MKKIYKVGDTYFNIENITSISEPEFHSFICGALKDEYVETPTKEVKSLSVYIDGKRFTSENYWDSDYNRGISLKGEELYKLHEKEVKEIFNAFLKQDEVLNDRD